MSWFSSIVSDIGHAVTSVVDTVETDVKDVADDIGDLGKDVVKGFEAAGAAADTFINDAIALPFGLGVLISQAVEGNLSGSVKMGDPSLTAAELQNGYTYQNDPNGELFAAGGPSVNDIQQGQVGDCYFLSTLGAVAAKDPDAIKNMVRDNGDGTYSVRFYVNDGFGTVPEWVTVDGKLPENSGGGTMAASTLTDPTNGKQITWVAIVEKAYAAFNSKDHIGGSGADTYDGTSGGMASNAYQAITGQTAEDVPVWFMSDSQLYDHLSQANSGQTIMASTDASEDAGSNIVASHCYTVLGTETRDGVQYVELRNPWDDSGTDLSTFEIPLSQFRQDYSTVTLPDQTNNTLFSDARQIITDM